MPLRTCLSWLLGSPKDGSVPAHLIMNMSTYCKCNKRTFPPSVGETESSMWPHSAVLVQLDSLPGPPDLRPERCKLSVFRSEKRKDPKYALRGLLGSVCIREGWPSGEDPCLCPCLHCLAQKQFHFCLSCIPCSSTWCAMSSPSWCKTPRVAHHKPFHLVHPTSNSVPSPFEACGSMVGPWRCLNQYPDTTRSW